jgi:hypothetical protein
VTSELLTLILNDALTPKSFDDIQNTIKSFREKEYCDKRVEYECAREYVIETKHLPPNSIPEFSAMDDPSGYNSSPNVPNSGYLVDIFQLYVGKHREVMNSVLDDRPPLSVLSCDHSHNTNRRTTVVVPPPPPEKRSSTSKLKTKRVPVEENASFYIMNADGTVSNIILHTVSIFLMS